MGIVRSANVCPVELVEEFSLRIKLDPRIRRMRSTPPAEPLVYGSPYDVDAYFEPLESLTRDLVLEPGDRVLACSADRYAMPINNFGLVQTKGSLARLFVATTCNDGQVEPGFNGKITLEIVSFSTCKIAIPVGASIAQLFVFRCTTPAAHPYEGRYNRAMEPTVADFSQRQVETK